MDEEAVDGCADEEEDDEGSGCVGVNRISTPNRDRSMGLNAVRKADKSGSSMLAAGSEASGCDGCDALVWANSVPCRQSSLLTYNGKL